MPTICYIHKDIGNIDRGGLCVLFKTLAQGMRNMGWKTSCVTTQELSIDGITTFKLPKEKDPHKHSKRVTKIIEKENFDIVESSNWRFELLDYTTKYPKPQRQSKVVVRCDPPAATLFPNMHKYSKYEKILCQKADKLIAVSKFAQETIRKKYNIKKITVIHNGIDPVNQKLLSSTTNCKVVKPDKINIFWVGKTTKMKGFDYLEKIVLNSPDNFFFIINIGHSVQEVRWSQQTLKRENHVFVQDLSKNDQLAIWSNCHVFVSTSRVEGFGIAVTEALSLGLPAIINKDCRAYSEFKGISGVTLEDVTNIKKLYTAIVKSSSKRYKINNLPKKLTSKEMVQKSIKIYQSLL